MRLKPTKKHIKLLNNYIILKKKKINTKQNDGP